MTRQIFLKLSRILESAMAGAGKQHEICKFQFNTSVCTQWQKMAEISKISGTSGVKRILPIEAKLYNLVGQCCWTKTLNWQALCPCRRLLPSLKLGPKTINFASPSPEGNSWKKTSMPANNVAEILYVYSPFLANPMYENCAHLRGGGQLVQILGRYVPQQNQKVDP